MDVHCVHIRVSGSQQFREDLNVAVAAGKDERSLAFLVPRVHVDVFHFDQVLKDLRLADFGHFGQTLVLIDEHVGISLDQVMIWIVKEFFDLCIDLLLELIKTAGSWRGSIATARGFIPWSLVFLLPLVRRLLVAVLLLLSLHSLSLHTVSLTKVQKSKVRPFSKF